MSFQEKFIPCSDCGTTFTFTTVEQEYFQSRGYTNDPKRCLPCRQTRQAEHTGSNYMTNRTMFPTTCTDCGKDTEVPFEPISGRPVYCSQCYQKIKVSR